MKKEFSPRTGFVISIIIVLVFSAGLCVITWFCSDYSELDGYGSTPSFLERALVFLFQPFTIALMIMLPINLILIGAVIFAWKYTDKKNIVPGVITEIYQPDGPGLPEWMKMIRFSDRGRRHRPSVIVCCEFQSPTMDQTFTIRQATDDPLKLKIGDKVDVYYNRNNPESSYFYLRTYSDE